jgi:hypothetical protein
MADIRARIRSLASTLKTVGTLGTVGTQKITGNDINALSTDFRPYLVPAEMHGNFSEVGTGKVGAESRAEKVPMKNNDLKAPAPTVPNVPTKFRVRAGPKNVCRPLPGILSTTAAGRPASRGRKTERRGDKPVRDVGFVFGPMCVTTRRSSALSDSEFEP